MPSQTNKDQEIQPSKKAPKLNREEWVLAAYRVLALKGVGAIHVESLAKSLGVTKGSFYWHFRDRAELLEAILEKWHDQFVILRVEDQGGNPRDKLVNLLEIVPRSRKNTKGGSIELAMRSWARHDDAAAKVVAYVDSERLEYVAELFEDLGYPKAEAEAHAFMLYSFVMCQGIFTFEDNEVLTRIHNHSVKHLLDAFFNK
jgi:AcrR family transcriptional regulator